LARIGSEWHIAAKTVDHTDLTEVASAGIPDAYVALGDSVSIDEVRRRAAGEAVRACSPATARDDFPAWRGRDLATLRPELTFWLLARDGGTTRSPLDAKLPRLETSRVRPRIVTLTVGGNDLLAAYGDTGAAREVVRVVRTRVGQALTRLSRPVAAVDPVVGLPGAFQRHGCAVTNPPSAESLPAGDGSEPRVGFASVPQYVPR
jgi:hypothetical protein